MLPTDATRVKRHPERATYDRDAVHAILDAGMVGHAAFAMADGRPVVIPMLYGRDGDDLFLHGSVASRLQRTLGRGVDACLTVTVVDGLVLARSVFHHSMNYRSVVVLGQAVAVTGADKERGLRAITEHLLPGRWAEARRPNEVELRQTAVLRLAIEEASAKARQGGPIDDDEDLGLPVWAGVVPATLAWGAPAPDGAGVSEIAVPPSLRALLSDGPPAAAAG